MNPLRAEIAAMLKEPASAAEIARSIGEPPQRINYHLKALEKAGLVRKVGTRQVRNLVEVLYQAVARTFVLSESLGLHPDAVRRIKDQSSLMHLFTTSERLKQDALLLMERSEANEEIPSASLHTRVYLSGEEERNRFVREYIDAVKRLAEKYQVAQPNKQGEGAAYQVVLAVYPEPARKEGEQ